MKDELKNAQRKHIGKGGIKCSCCHSKDEKKPLRRIGRRILKQSDKEHLKKEE